MPADFPIHTVILITGAIIPTGVIIWMMLSETLTRMTLPPQIKRNWRWGAGLVLGLWLLVRLAVQIAPPGGGALGAPFVFGFVVFGLTVGTLPLTFSKTFRQIIRTTPPTWLIAVHIVRIVGGLFLPLVDMKLLPGDFARPAGYGDVIAAVLAPFVIYALVSKKPYARSLAIAWNIYGMLDLITALTTGTLFIPGFAAQLGATGASLLYLNWVLIIPAYGVPLVGLLHIYSLYQLLARHGAATSQDAAAQPSVLARN